MCSSPGGRLGLFLRRDPPVQVHDARDVLDERVPGGEGHLGREVVGFFLVVAFAVFSRPQRRKRVVDRIVDVVLARRRRVHASVALRHAHSDGIHFVEGESSPLREGEGRFRARQAKREGETAILMLERRRRVRLFFSCFLFFMLTLKDGKH